MPLLLTAAMAIAMQLSATGGTAAALPAALPHANVTVDTPRGPVRFEVELATDDASRLRGLMYRRHLDPNAGMLFDFHDSDFRNFWMRNTVIPLDMLFIRADGTIASIAANTTPMSERVISSQVPVRAVLEINAGRSAALDIRPGEKVHTAVLGDPVGK